MTPASIVGWQSLSRDILAHRFDSSGNRIGAEFAVNSNTTGSYDGASVAAAADGSFVAAWQKFDQDGDDSGIFARRFIPRVIR